MIAVRWATMAAVTLAILGALGATLSDVQPSAQRVLAAAVVALLAPLFWPGVAATPARTALRVTLWSAAAAALAAVAMWLFGAGAQPLARIAGTGAMLWLVLLATHALAAMLEQRWLGQSPDAPGAREAAGRSAAVALALLGALPLWLGPVAETLSARHDWAIDAVVGASPLTHLAVASGNDLLRNQWFYQHANLAALLFSYPGPAGIAWSYIAAIVLLALAALALRRHHARDAAATHH